MTETVIVTPAGRDYDDDGDPVTAGDPLTLTPLEIAPGNGLRRYGAGGDLTDVEFTVYLPPRVRTDADTWTATETLISDGDLIEVRGRQCVAMVSVWRSQRGGNRGGVAVLARSRAGKAA